MRFLDTLPSDLPDARLAELDGRWKLSQATNYEIARSWLLLAVRNDYAPVEPELTAFLVATGRHKMVNQLYTELARTPERCAVGLRIYAKARPGYHPITQTMVDRLLKDCPRP
jgi:hypothetical protein